MLASCSGGSAPVNPDIASTQAPDSFGTKIDGGNIVAAYDAVIDPEAGTFTITPTDRVGSYHFPLSQYYPSVVKITAYGWSPNFWADIKISHPYPGSGIDAFDARVIGIIPANTGVSFNYPGFGVQGNNKVALQPDGYTKLFDSLGGSIVGNVNPFKAYFKSTDHRIWSSTGTSSETQRWQMNLAGFGGAIKFKLVVDVSTNFPATPAPVTDNAKEPVDISCLVGTGLTTTGGSATVTATLLDWQGQSGTTCQIEAPALFDGLVTLPYTGPGTNPDTYIFSGSITNSKGATQGTYPVMIAGFDNATRVYMFRESTAEVAQASTGKIKSTAFLEKVADDSWFDIGVAPDSYVFVVADHPETANTGAYRTCLRYNNDLTNQMVLSPGTGLNYGYTTPFDRCDASVAGNIALNADEAYMPIYSTDAAGNVTDILGGGYYIWCSVGTFYATMTEVFSATSAIPGPCVAAYQQVPAEECGVIVDGIIWGPDSDPLNNMGLSVTVQMYTWTDIVGINAINDTENLVFFLSSDTEGRLSLSGGWYDINNPALELNTVGSYGTGDQQFKGGKDIAIDSQGNILTLEDHGTMQRFQKWSSDLVWIYTSQWQDSGIPMRMDFDQADNMLYLLCDNGIHICSVE